MLKKKTIELLKKVKKHILAEPRRLDMDTMGEESDEAPCGTVACIGGWACVLNYKRPRIYYDFCGYLYVGNEMASWERARRILDLSEEEAELLFTEPKEAEAYTEARNNGDDRAPLCWPLSLARRYMEAKTPRGRANASAKRIDLFIASGGEK